MVTTSRNWSVEVRCSTDFRSAKEQPPTVATEEVCFRLDIVSTTASTERP